MGYESNPNEYRASSSAFQWGDLVHTDYPSGCLRKILIQANTPDRGIDQKYVILGALNEERHARRLQSEGRVFQREVAYHRPIAAHPSVFFSGHSDFNIFGAFGRLDWVDELKSVSSVNSKRRYIRDGNYLPENLAQLVRYMTENKVIRGRLIYTYWEVPKESDDGAYEATDERIYLVKIDDYGRICVDGVATQFTVMDLLAHENAAGNVIANHLVGPRPYRGEIPFQGACHWCKFRKACDSYDRGTIGGKSLVETVITNMEEEKDGQEE